MTYAETKTKKRGNNDQIVIFFKNLMKAEDKQGFWLDIEKLYYLYSGINDFLLLLGLALFHHVC